MTFSVKRNTYDDRTIDIQYTYGPVTIVMTEFEGHLGYFRRQLEEVIAAKPKEQVEEAMLADSDQEG